MYIYIVYSCVHMYVYTYACVCSRYKLAYYSWCYVLCVCIIIVDVRCFLASLYHWCWFHRRVLPSLSIFCGVNCTCRWFRRLTLESSKLEYNDTAKCLHVQSSLASDGRSTVSVQTWMFAAYSSVGFLL